MATSLWNSFLHLLKSFWVFLCKLCHRPSKCDLTTVLPITSPPPIIAHGIVINICAPPDDLPVVGAPSTLSPPNSGSHASGQGTPLPFSQPVPQVPDKQEFLDTPRSYLVEPRYQDEKQRRRHAVSVFSVPNICIQNWDNPQSKSPDVHQPLSSTPVSTVSPLPSAPLAQDVSAPSIPEAILPDAPPHNEAVEVNGLSIDQRVDGHGRDSAEPLIESSGEIFKMSFEPMMYPLSALSALSDCNFSDILCGDTASARMVPLPLYTSTPPRPHPTEQKDTRLSLLPYADLFDFSMYSSRVSHDSFDGFSFGALPPDVPSWAPTTEVDPTPSQPSEIAYRDRYRNSAYSEPTGPHCRKPATTPIGPASNYFSLSDRKHLRELSLNCINSNSPLARRMSGVSAASVRDSSFSKYSQSSASSGDLTMKCLEDIGTFAYVGCADEGFLKLVLE